MELDGLDYNTSREKLRLKAYGREIQSMVDLCMTLPTKEERQKCALVIIDAMKRVVPSQQNFKERTPALWYHLALMSDFKLDIDYPVEIVYEDKMAVRPDTVPYGETVPMVRHYGKLMKRSFETLATMEPGAERDALANLVAMQMHRDLTEWSYGSNAKEKVADDMARYTDGVIQLDPNELSFGHVKSNRLKVKGKRGK